jgi:hypothetical protein
MTRQVVGFITRAVLGGVFFGMCPIGCGSPTVTTPIQTGSGQQTSKVGGMHTDVPITIAPVITQSPNNAPGAAATVHPAPAAASSPASP